MKNTRIEFDLIKGKTEIVYNGKTALTVAFDEELEIKMYYSIRLEPLVLRGSGKVGDKVRLDVYDYRIELYINSELVDEEWPYGEIDLYGEKNGDFEISIFDFEPKAETELPNIIRSGLNLDTIRRPGVNIGDCMPYSDEKDGDGRFHLFWLYDRHHHASKWIFGAHQWAHASTLDFKTWDEHPMAISITEQIEGSICTGSIYRDEQGKYSAWYAQRMMDESPARLTRAVSEDNIHYVKSNKYFTLPEQYKGAGSRDPKVVYYDGKYHMFVTTCLIKDEEGCLAHLVSNNPDMSDYTDLGPIITTHSKSQPECSDWFKMGEFFYLVWSEEGKARYIYSRDPFGESGWIIPENNAVLCGQVPKSAVCPWNGRRIFVGFLPEDAWGGCAIAKAVIQMPDGRLEFEDVE